MAQALSICCFLPACPPLPATDPNLLLLAAHGTSGPLAGELGGPVGVGLAVVVGLAGRAVDVDLNGGVVGLVGAGEADGAAGRLGTAARDADLGASVGQ